MSPELRMKQLKNRRLALLWMGIDIVGVVFALCFLLLGLAVDNSNSLKLILFGGFGMLFWQSEYHRDEKKYDEL